MIGNTPIGHKRDDYYMFLWKADTSGRTIWAYTSDDYINPKEKFIKRDVSAEDIALTPEGTAYITGFCRQGNILVGDIHLRGKGAYLAAFDSSGKALYAKSLRLNDVVYNIQLPASGDLYFYIELNHTLKVGDRKIYMTQKDRNDYFVGKVGDFKFK
jgi:hypothetical protein